MLRRMLVPPLHVRADRGRGRVEDRHAVPLDDLPPTTLVGEVRRPLVQHRGSGVAQRPVDDVAVTGDPADVGRTPVDIALRLQVEDVVVRRRGADEIPARRVRDPLRLRGRAGRVHEEKEILSVHRLGRAARGVGGGVEVVQPAIATVLHRHVVSRALHDEAGTDTRRGRHRVVGGALQGHRRAPPPRLVLGDQHLAAHVVRAIGERVRREAAENDRVRRAEPRAREHRDRQLGDHPHVDRDLRPLADAELLEHVRHPDDLRLQLGVGERAPLALGLALPVIGHPLAEPRLDVPVDAVVRDVELAAQVPLRIGQLPLEQVAERLEPGHALAALGLPEVLDGTAVDVRLRVRLGRELRRGRIPPLLDEDRLDRLPAGKLAHSSRSYGKSVSTSQPSSVTSRRSSTRAPP